MIFFRIVVIRFDSNFLEKYIFLKDEFSNKNIPGNIELFLFISLSDFFSRYCFLFECVFQYLRLNN